MNREEKLDLIFRETHRDRKGGRGSNRTISVLRAGGTWSVPLEELTDEEIEEKLPKVGVWRRWPNGEWHIKERAAAENGEATLARIQASDPVAEFRLSYKRPRADSSKV